MAEVRTVSQVADLLPVGAKVGSEAWDRVKIDSLLDEGNTVNQLMSRYWHAQAAATATMVDVSESGSSRSLSSIHENAVRMAQFWDEKVRAEEEDAAQAANTRNSVVIHRAVRI